MDENEIPSFNLQLVKGGIDLSDWIFVHSEEELKAAIELGYRFFGQIDREEPEQRPQEPQTEPPKRRGRPPKAKP